MALNLFLPGVDTVEDVLEIRAAAIEQLKAGSQVLSWTSEGTSMTKAFTLPIRTVLEECNVFLQTVDSGSYGKRVTRTRAAYNLYTSYLS